MSQRRPPIPESVKLLVWDRDACTCDECKEAIASFDLAEFDHRPALWVRERNMDFPPSNPRHYIPNANDPAFIFPLHGKKTPTNCHHLRTFGNGLNRGDVTNSARSKRILQKAFSRTTERGYSLLNTSVTPEETVRKKKRAWGLRPFNSKGQRKMQSRPMRRSA